MTCCIKVLLLLEVTHISFKTFPTSLQLVFSGSKCLCLTFVLLSSPTTIHNKGGDEEPMEIIDVN